MTKKGAKNDRRTRTKHFDTDRTINVSCTKSTRNNRLHSKSLERDWGDNKPRNKTKSNIKELDMTNDFANKMKTEIQKVQDPKEKKYLEKILDFECKNNVDIEQDMIQCAILPQKIGITVGVEPSDSEVWYQQYRTMKALIQKQQFTDTVKKVIELDDKEQLDKVFEIK